MNIFYKNYNNRAFLFRFGGTGGTDFELHFWKIGVVDSLYATVFFDGVVAEVDDLFEETLRTAFGDNVGDLIAREDVGDLGDVGVDSDLSTTESDFDDIDL